MISKRCFDINIVHHQSTIIIVGTYIHDKSKMDLQYKKLHSNTVANDLLLDIRRWRHNFLGKDLRIFG